MDLGHQQLLDSLTAHLALFHSSSRPTPNPRPTPSSTSSPRPTILRWFSSLPVSDRRAALTILDPPFVSVVVHMLSRLRRHGHGFFFLLPDLPRSSSSSPSICFRRSRGLLARAAAADPSESALGSAVLLFSSREGEAVCPLDTVTVLEGFVSDVDRFVDVMDGVSGGRFLRGEEDGGSWPELPWLKDKGYYSLEAFVANRLEVALRLSWASSQGGRKLKGAKAAKDKVGVAGVAANAFWRKKGCLDWWDRLDQRHRKNILSAVLEKGAKSLANEIVMGPNNSLKPGFCFCNTEAGSMLSYATASWQTTKQSFFARNRCICLDDMNLMSVNKEPTFSKVFNRLLVLQEIALLKCNIYQYQCDNVFFTTLASAGTISDVVITKLRGLLMVLSVGCTNIELLGEDKSKVYPIKGEGKSNSGCRRKSKSRKLKSSTKESKEYGRAGAECNNTEAQPPQDVVLFVGIQTPNTNTNGVLQDNSRKQSVSKEHALGLGDCKGHSTKRKSKRKGKTKISILSKAESIVSENSNSSSSIAAGSAQEIDELNCAIYLNPESKDSAARGDLLPGTDTYNVSNKLDIMDGNGIAKNTEVTDDMHSCASDSFGAVGSAKSDGFTMVKCTSASTTCIEISQPSASALITDENNRYNRLIGSSAASSTGNAEAECEKMPALMVFDGKSGLVRKELEHNNFGITSSILSSAVPPSALPGTLNNNGLVTKNDGGEYYMCNNRNTLGGTSYEWPSITPSSFISADSHHLPPATDRLHLDVGRKWPAQFDQSFLPSKHQVTNSSNEGACSRMLPSLPLPSSFDWPPMFRSYNRASQNMALGYDTVHTARRQSSAWSCLPAQGMQIGGSLSDNDRKYYIESDVRNASDFADDTESYWFSEEESDGHAYSGRDYNQYFGGGVMYWSPAEYVGTGFSRPPSHSSDDSAWAWHEADISRVIDDMVGMPGLPSSYSTNGVASPPATPFCSMDSLGTPHQSAGYSMVGSEFNGKVMKSSSSLSDGPEEKAALSANNSSCSVEGKGDNLPYTMLRPIIVPGISRRGSRSEFKLGHDHKSPCIPSTWRDLPRVKRPPSPVVLCVPRVPRPPPPSPVGESRKRGFPVVRSGSSSPRHWGVRNLFSDEKFSDKTQLGLDGPEVVWPSWGNKGFSTAPMVHAIQGPLLQDHLMTISQLSRDQHPDIALPLQPPELLNCTSNKASLSLMHNLLHEEIDFFYKQVAAGNLIRKPYVNWAAKRVSRCLQVLWPRSRTNIFGSNATGLALPTSDVDIVVSLPPVRNLEPIKEAGILEGRNGIKETCLQHAARYLANQEWVRSDSLKTIENTAIPVIMLVAEVPSDATLCNENSIDSLQDHSNNILAEQGSPPHSDNATLESSSLPVCVKMNKDDDVTAVKSIHLDISFKSQSHTGLQTSELVRELTQQFPASAPLALVLKKFLADRSLDHSYSGGLSSYCLILLITRFLQHEHHLGQPIKQNLGSLLMDFLYFFGNIFDPRRMRISIQGSGIYMNRERGLSIDPIHIDDPLYPANNVGRNCFRIHQCIKAFADAFSVLENELKHFSGDSTPTSASTFWLLQKIIPSIDCEE